MNPSLSPAIEPQKAPPIQPTNSSESSKEKSEEKEETSSNESSSGKSGSGSGGYNADCSASDQSSDDNGNRKRFGAEGTAASEKIKASKGGILGESKRTSEMGRAKRSPGRVDGLFDIETFLSRKSGEVDQDSRLFDGCSVLPQVNGVKVKHPMDPRIDMSRVGQTSSSLVPLPAALNQSSKESELPPSSSETIATPIHSIESYMQLLQVVRPFFYLQGVPLQTLPVEGCRSSSQGDSSEGFTSFFTTTQTGESNTTTNSGSPNSSDFEKKDARGSSRQDNSDALSTAPAAPSTRKRREPGEAAGGSSLSGEKRVRIRESANQRHESDPMEHDAQRDSTSSANSDPQNVEEARDSSESSSTGQGNPQNQLAVDGNVPSRVVTDISSSNRTDSGVGSSNSNRATSGSGSATNSGCGSNPGSSGSGNEKGSSEEQRGDTGEGTNEGSDLSESRNELSGNLCEAAVREKKLLDKKRKRIEMRREYEANQSVSSQSTQLSGDIFLKPGKPTTLDQLMVVSKIPRIVVQALPPFCVVHTNAAYSLLTGNCAHSVAGKPLSTVFNVLELVMEDSTPKAPESRAPPDELSEHLAKAAAAGKAKAEATAATKTSTAVGLSRLVDTNEFGRVHFAHVSAKSHIVVGRNVSFVRSTDRTKSGDPIPAKTEPAQLRDESSNDTSLTNSCRDGPYLTCRAHIAPVVSSPEMIGTRNDQFENTRSKRRKHREASNQDSTESSGRPESSTDKCTAPQLVTHYVIQLQVCCDSSIKNESNGSLSSNPTSIEARTLGISKSELQQRRLEAASKEPIEAVG